MRAPMQVLVLPYRIVNEVPEYCIFRRADAGYWQFISGGGEDEETPLEAARREAFEEAEIDYNLDYYKLTSQTYIPVEVYCEENRKGWPKDIFVIPEHSFGVKADNSNMNISNEHTEYKWVTFEEGNELLYWNSNRVAMYELNRRIKENVF